MKKILIIFMTLFCFTGCASALPVYESELPPILIQGAMKIETERLISALEDPVDYTIRKWHYTAGKINGYPVVVSLTKCGFVYASTSTTLALETFSPCAVINQGTAGAHDPELSSGDIVIMSDCFDASAWHSEPSAKGEGVDYKDIDLLGVRFYELGMPQSEDIIFLPSDEKLKASALAVKDKYKSGRVVEGRISSTPSWENRIDRILFLYEKFGSSCEEMETFAVANICRIYGVPFLGVRVISNSAMTGEKFIPETGIECQKFVLEIVKNYIEKIKSHS